MVLDAKRLMLSRRAFCAYSASSFLASSTRRARALPTFNVMDFGAIRGGDARAPDAGTLGRRNQEAFRKAIDAARSANGGTLLFPRGDYVVAAVESQAGTRTPVGRVSRQGIVLEGCRNIRIVGEDGARLIRPESDITDKDGIYDSTLCIRRSSNITVEGLTFEGQQSFSVKQTTTGDNVLLELGSQDILIRNITCEKGTNAIAIGLNRYFDGNRIRYDVKSPVRNIEICDVRSYNGEHGILINIAEFVKIEGYTHDKKIYSHGGVEQESYIQRGIYLLGCRNVTVRNVVLNNIHKVSFFMALYPPYRSYGNISNISVTNLRINAAKQQNNDFHTAIQLVDMNIVSGAQTVARDVSFDMVDIHGSKVALSLGRRREQDDREKDGTLGLNEIPRERIVQAVSDLSFSRVTARTTKFGVKAVFTKPFGRVSIASSRFEVADELDYAPPGNVGEGMQVEGYGQGDELLLKDVDVFSPDKGASFSNISGSFNKCMFGYTSKMRGSNRFDLRMHNCDIKMTEVTLYNNGPKAP